MAKKAKKAVRRAIRCYLCGRRFEVSSRTMSTTCPGCHKAIKVEDVRVKTYLGLIDLKTCGRISITRRGRVAARIIQSGGGIECEGAMEGNVETDGAIQLGPKASWKGRTLQSRTLTVADGATLLGRITVPWAREDP
jgi:hypothetical protein